MPSLKVRNETNTAWITMGWGEDIGGGSESVVDLRNEPYVTVAASSLLTAERVLTAGSGITIVDGGGTVTVNAAGGSGDLTDIPFLTLTAQPDLANERYLAAAAGLSLVDTGPGFALTITPAWGTPADPSVDLAASTPGVANSFARSDHAHQLDQNIAPTWTGIHAFDNYVRISNSNELRFYDNGNYVGFEAGALGADQIWVLPTADGNANDVLVTGGGGGGVLSWAAPSTLITHAILDGTVHTDSVADAVTRGSIIIGNDTPKWDELVIGAAGQHLESDGTDISWVTNLTMADGATIGQVAGPLLTFDDVADTLALEGAYLWLDQYDDSAGIGISGYDDLAAESLQLYLNALGTSVIIATGALYLDATSIAVGANLSLDGNDLIIDTDGDSYLHASADDVVDLVLAGASGEFGITINGAEDFTFTANAFNVLAGSGIVMADGATIGQAAGPLVAFDDTLDYLEITGCKVGVGITAPVADLHVSGGDAGGSVTSNTQLFVESNGACGIAMQCTNAANTSLYLGTASDGDYGIVRQWASLHATRPGEFSLYVAGPEFLTVKSGKMGVGIVAPTAKLHVDQASTSGAIPVLTLDQADIDQVVMKIIGSAGAGSADQALVADSDFGTPGALVGWFQIAVQDDGNRIADADYFVPFYAIPT